MGRKHYAINIWFFYLIAIGIFAAWASFMSYRIEESALCILSAFASFIVWVNLIFIPFGYSFDKNGVSIHYVFYKKESYLWKNIKNIREGYSHMLPEFDFMPRTTYEIEGKPEGGEKKYMIGKIMKYPATKRFIKKYWGEIEEL